MQGGKEGERVGSESEVRESVNEFVLKQLNFPLRCRGKNNLRLKGKTEGKE